MKQLFYIFLLLCFLSCKNKTDKSDLQLSDTQFKEVLLSLHSYEGGLNTTIFRQDSLYKLNRTAYDSIFEKHQVSEQDFLSDYNLYLTHFPNDLDTIYQTIINDLNVKLDSLVKIKQDSIQKANRDKLIDRRLEKMERKRSLKIGKNNVESR